MKKFLLLIAATAFALLTTACTDSSGYTYETVKNDPLKTRIYTLDNGLKVYMSVNKAEPRIETYIAVKVGGKNDPSETTGLAHYFEHLMFKGTQQFGTSNYEAEKPLLDQIEQLFEVYRKTTDDAERAAIYRQINSISYEASKYAIPNEYDKLMSAIGALETNANTSMDRTVYIENIPSNQIENWARIQADRFKNVVIRGFHTELETIYEEKNMSLTDDNRKVYTTIGEVLYPNHPYGKQSVLGTQEHLKNPSITNVKNYHTQYYVPNNMAILLSGDFDPDQMIATIDKYFGDMQPNENIPQLAFEPEAPITKPIVKEVYGPDAANVTLAWRTDNAASSDAEYLLLASRILYNGQAVPGSAGRLWSPRAARSSESGSDPRRGPGSVARRGSETPQRRIQRRADQGGRKQSESIYHAQGRDERGTCRNVPFVLLQRHFLERRSDQARPHRLHHQGTTGGLGQ